MFALDFEFTTAAGSGLSCPEWSSDWYGNNETAMGVVNNLFLLNKGKGSRKKGDWQGNNETTITLSLIVKHIPPKYSFFFAAILRIHFKIHCEEKTHKCNQCDFASVHTHSLRTHLKIHSGKKSQKKQSMWLCICSGRPNTFFQIFPINGKVMLVMMTRSWKIMLVMMTRDWKM